MAAEDKSCPVRGWTEWIAFLSPRSAAPLPNHLQGHHLLGSETHDLHVVAGRGEGVRVPVPEGVAGAAVAGVSAAGAEGHHLATRLDDGGGAGEHDEVGPGQGALAGRELGFDGAQQLNDLGEGRRAQAAGSARGLNDLGEGRRAPAAGSARGQHTSHPV